jgi:hypothetical protein
MDAGVGLKHEEETNSSSKRRRRAEGKMYNVQITEKEINYLLRGYSEKTTATKK